MKPIPDLSEDLFATFSATMVGQPVPVTTAEAQELGRDIFGIDGTAQHLTGERDENFRLDTADGLQYVLKVSSPEEDPLITDLPTAALLHLEAVDPGLPIPRVIRAQNGDTSPRFTDVSGAQRTVRLLTWLPGLMLQTSTRSREQRRACGAICARMGHGLRDFRHPAGRRPILWDYRQFGCLDAVLKDVLIHKPNYAPATFIADFLEQYKRHVEPKFDSLRQQVLHNDLNLRNVLVDAKDHSRVAGIIDFGDVVDSVLVGDVAIAAAAQITGPASLLNDVLDMVAAYHAVEPLTAQELDMLPWLIRARFVMGILIPAWHQIKNPENIHYQGKKEAEVSERIEMSQILCEVRLTVDQIHEHNSNPGAAPC